MEKAVVSSVDKRHSGRISDAVDLSSLLSAKVMKHVAKQVTFQNALEKPQQQYIRYHTIGNRVYARARTNDGAPIYVEQEYTPVYYLPLSGKDKDSASHWGYEGTTSLFPYVR
jgi:hypothetical protein